jgi:hypothetical protein
MLAPVRGCSKTRCNEPAAATAAVRYGSREVALFDLFEERDPNHLELCVDHADQLVPPIGWTVRDERGRRASALGAARFLGPSGLAPQDGEPAKHRPPAGTSELLPPAARA